MRVGLIGVGLVGSALAERLESGGVEVVAYDASPERTRTPHIKQAVTAGAVLFLSLPESRAVSAVLATISGRLSAGQIVVDTTTGTPEEAAGFERQLAGQSVAYIDACVAGSSTELRRGEVNVLAGGAKEAVAAVRPLLEQFAKNVFHVGPCGSGSRMKLVSNLVLGLHRAVLAEALSFADHMGIDRELALQVLKAGTTYSHVMDNKGEKMLRGEYEPDARLSQHFKDVRLMLETGAWLPLTEVHARLLARAEELGFAAADNSAIIEAYRREADG